MQLADLYISILDLFSFTCVVMCHVRVRTHSAFHEHSAPSSKISFELPRVVNELVSVYMYAPHRFDLKNVEATEVHTIFCIFLQIYTGGQETMSV